MGTKQTSNTDTQMVVTWRIDPETPTPVSPYAEIFARFGVPTEFFAAFTQFVESGKVSDDLVHRDEFLHRLERDANWQLALEKAFAQRIGWLQDALRVVKTKRRQKTT